MFDIVCFGEMLWDVLPDKELPGGAPMNAAYHLQKLSRQVAVISKVGKDNYGDRLISLLRNNGLHTDGIRQDPVHPTGKVLAQPISDHDVQYNFLFPVAWDFIEWEPAYEKMLRQAEYLVFGSLATRHDVSRETLYKALQYGIKKVLDINLRPPHYTKEGLSHLLGHCHILKLNNAELELISAWNGDYHTREDKVRGIARKYDIKTIVVTMGGEGAMLYMNEQFYYHPGFRVLVADTIGSGDAFLAGFLNSLMHGRTPQQCLAYANAMGALVASRSGACPDYDVWEIETLLD
jgi:fructokinase